MSPLNALNFAPTVAITPVGGSFLSGFPVGVTITAADDKTGTTIYYTTDGSTPTAASLVYTAPINVSTTTTIKTIVKDSEGLFSGVASQTYTFLTVGDIIVKFKPPVSWIAPIKVYHWSALPSANLVNATWPGKTMTGPDTDGYYSYTFTNIASTNIIFTRGTGSPQTTDIVGVTQNTRYNMSSGTLLVEAYTLGINEIVSKSTQLQLYPNPVLGAFKINIEASDIDVIDVTGKIVKQFKGSFEANSNFDISDLVKGMYFVKVKSNQRFETTLKLIKQ